MAETKIVLEVAAEIEVVLRVEVKTEEASETVGESKKALEVKAETGRATEIAQETAGTLTDGEEIRVASGAETPTKADREEVEVARIGSGNRQPKSFMNTTSLYAKSCHQGNAPLQRHISLGTVYKYTKEAAGIIMEIILSTNCAAQMEDGVIVRLGGVGEVIWAPD